MENELCDWRIMNGPPKRYSNDRPGYCEITCELQLFYSRGENSVSKWQRQKRHSGIRLYHILNSDFGIGAPRIWLPAACELCLHKMPAAVRLASGSVSFEDAAMFNRFARLPILCVRLCVLLLPAVLLAGSALREEDATQIYLLWLGTRVSVMCLLSQLPQQPQLAAAAGAVGHHPLPARARLAVVLHEAGRLVHSLCRAILVIVPLIVFGMQSLTESGATRLRRANLLAQRLARRKEWPTDLAACRTLPEVKAFRAAMGFDAAPGPGPAAHPTDRGAHRRPGRPGVSQGLASRTGRDWSCKRPNRPSTPALRAAAISALGYLEDRGLVEMLAQFLPDPSPEVRKATAEALLWDSEHRWHWIRFAVRRLLSDPLYRQRRPADAGRPGADPGSGARFDRLVCGKRRAVRPGRRDAGLALCHDPQRTSGPSRPCRTCKSCWPIRRPRPCCVWNWANCCSNSRNSNLPLLRKLLDPSNPAPLRLIACETILGSGDGGSRSQRRDHGLARTGPPAEPRDRPEHRRRRSSAGWAWIWAWPWASRLPRAALPARRRHRPPSDALGQPV